MFKIRLVSHVILYGVSALIVILSNQISFAGYVIQILISLFLSICLEVSLKENKELKTEIKNMIRQEIFDTIAKGILSQGGASVNKEYKLSPNTSSFCSYRSSDGRKCAAGWLIKDSDYNPSFEGKSFASPQFNNIFGNDLDYGFVREL